MAKISDYPRVSEAAEHLGISKDTPRCWDRAGKLEARRQPVNRFRLYLRSGLGRFLRRIEADATGKQSVRGKRKSKRRR